MSKKLLGSILLLLTALIWGSGFVAQSEGMQYIGPFTFNMARSFIAFIVLIPVTLIFRKQSLKKHPLARDERKSLNRHSLIAGLFSGLALGAACSFQQIGISMTTVGKAGFVSALYIIIVPILGIFFKKKIRKMIRICAALGVVGFFLLCVNTSEGFSIGIGDILVFVSSILFSVQMMIIDHYTAKDIDCIMMSCFQFLIAGIISLILAVIFEDISFSAIWAARITILFSGVLASGGGYTFQIIGQKYTEPTVAAFLLSLESVFSVLAGWIFLHESMSLKELAGCALVFIAVILAQLPEKNKRSEIKKG